MASVMVSVLGGTGLLGQRAGAELVARGHDVVSLSRHPLPPDRPVLVEVEHRTFDAFASDERSAQRALSGCDALVYAIGPDDREVIPSDPEAFFEERLVQTTSRIITAAAQVGISKVIMLGSYFCTWERMHPELGFASRHPYVRARLRQSEQAIDLGTRLGVEVCVLEIPWVFGTIHGEGRRWKELLFDRANGPAVLFPTGGTSVVTSIQVGEAVAGALQRGQHGARYPLADLDLTWRELMSHVLQARGKSRTPIIGVPAWLAEFGARSMARSLSARGLKSGLDPKYLVRDILTQHMYVDATLSRQVLRYSPGGVPQAIRLVVREAYDMPRQEELVGQRIGR